MSDSPKSINSQDDDQRDAQLNLEINEKQKEVIEKDFVPHFIPTYRIKSLLYPLPIVIVIVFAAILAYLTFFVAGIQIEESYVSEAEFGALAAVLNGAIFTIMAVVSAFVIVFLIKKFGIDVLKYIFGLSFAFISFFMTLMFSEVIIYVIFVQFPETTFVLKLYFLLINIYLPTLTAILVFLILYKYYTSKSINTKNLIVLYVSLLISASMSIILPFWSTLAILIGISFWDIFGVLYKHGPIKAMIDIASQNDDENNLTKTEIKEKIKNGEIIYDTSKLEIGIGDLAFYSLLTSSVLLHTNNVIIMVFTTVAILIGTGITISGLKRNKILPGLPISIFLGIGAFFLSQFTLNIFF